MGRSADERVTNDVAREICQREGIKAMLTGTIASLGSHYVVTLAAVNRATGDSLAREQVEAESKEQVLKSLDKAASSLRRKWASRWLRCSNSPSRWNRRPLRRSKLCKPSAWARREHSEVQRRSRHSPSEARRRTRPQFRHGLATLGSRLQQHERDSRKARGALKKAYELRDRASEREKFYIQAHYYDEVITRSLKRHCEVYAEWRQTYPRDTIPYDNGALAYAELGQHEKALDMASQAHASDPEGRLCLRQPGRRLCGAEPIR